MDYYSILLNSVILCLPISIGVTSAIIVGQPFVSIASFVSFGQPLYHLYSGPTICITILVQQFVSSLLVCAFLEGFGQLGMSPIDAGEKVSKFKI